jgi:hypothetical protein
VSLEEQKDRRQMKVVKKRKNEEWRAAQARADKATSDESASKKTPDDFRDFYARMTCSGRALDIIEFDAALTKLYPFKFSPDARAKMEAVLDELEALIRGAQVLPLHSEKVSGGKAHLRLAWSASSGPASGDGTPAAR